MNFCLNYKIVIICAVAMLNIILTAIHIDIIIEF